MYGSAFDEEEHGQRQSQCRKTERKKDRKIASVEWQIRSGGRQQIKCILRSLTARLDNMSLNQEATGIHCL